MRVGILLPGFSSSENDWAIPVQLNLVREMAKQDDVRVLALRYPHHRDRYTVHGAEVCSLGVGQVRGLRRLALWVDTLLTLRRLHRDRPFDVLHAMWADETGLIATWAGRWLGVPVVVSIAGGELVGFDDINYGLQRSPFSRWIVGQALHGADRVAAACTYAARLIPQAGYQLSPDKTRIITLGMDTTVFRPSERPISSKKLIHAASLVPVKDQATLLRALARLDESITLDIIGTGPQEPHLRSLAAELGISQRVRFVGAVPHLETPAYYQQAALNILCSRHEGLGMVTLEAAACGIPTVGTTVGLLPDHPALGISVTVGDDAALASAVQLLLDDEQKRAALGAAARNLVEEHFTIQETVRQFRALYAELVANKSH
ncbi:MAG: glycosyltransferase [Chloroflexi bacterium]|nr:glycosyltransferase [Chloroflexota bacterium]MCC6891858.1 glycosyltransferase [Anaerolineae bacterium]